MRAGMARPRVRPGAGPGGRAHGFTFIELMFVVAAIAMVSSAAVPGLWHATSRYRTAGAVRFITAALQQARADAVARGVTVALRFTATPEGIRFATYVDGNRNGISTIEILNGVDPLMMAAQGLGDFGGADFGVWPGIAAPDGAPLLDADPIRVGGSNLVSFTPNGTATAGSLYVRGPGGLQYAVRIHGDTGKTQILRYARGERTWQTQ
jgi:prepilin-type N-terminal cleavage/methylation domain-containing protein